jgi:hypothetical protein
MTLTNKDTEAAAATSIVLQMHLQNYYIIF